MEMMSRLHNLFYNAKDYFVFTLANMEVLKQKFLKLHKY